MTESPVERWRAEKTAAFLSHAVAAAESDPAKQRLFAALADAAEEQAGILADEFDGAPPDFAPDLRSRIIAWLARRLGPRAARPILIAAKVRGFSVYTAAAAPSAHAMPVAVEEVGGRHRGGGSGALRAAVFGVNDGLVSNTSLVMGVAGAVVDAHIIVVSGVAGMLAGAFSMAAGEYVSMRTQREMFEHQIAQERAELETYPEEEAEELALIYNARGVPLEEARQLANRIITDPEKALDTLAREELGLNPDELGSPWGAALWSFLAFAVGAVVPLIPFALGVAGPAIPAAAVLSGLALFAVGATMSLFSGRSAVFGGVRMVFIGALAATATYGIGTLFGVALG